MTTICPAIYHGSRSVGRCTCDTDERRAADERYTNHEDRYRQLTAMRQAARAR